MISDTVIAQIKQRLNIAEVVGEYVKLKRTGRGFKGVCPFHADSDPSFHVNPDRQFYYCFGCGAKGDVIRFVMQMEGKSFHEAAEALAARAGVEIERIDDPAQRRSRTERQREREQYHAMLEASVAFFEEKLKSPEGRPAREEIKRRQIPDATATAFRLGFAPDAWDGLLNHLGRRGYAAADIEKAGLALPGKNGHYDRFRNRLMFPVLDEQGRPIAFSGRALAKDEQGAKYINSPETPYYRKGHVVFGLAQAKTEIRKKNTAVLVEGNFDLVSLHAAGFSNTVAPLGTALTSEQAHLIRRFTDKVILCFDGDKAGQAAAARALSPLKEAGLAVFTALLPTGEDPDSLVRKGGSQAVVDLLAQARDLLEVLIDEAAASTSANPDAVARAVAELSVYLQKVKEPLARDLYAKRIATRFAIEEASVHKALRRSGSRPSGAPASGGPLQDWNLRRETEREIVGILMDFPALLETLDFEAAMTYFSVGPYRDLLQRIAQAPLPGDQADPLALIEGLGDDEAERFASHRLVAPVFRDFDDARKVLTVAMSTLKKRCYLREEAEKLNRRIAEAERAGDDHTLAGLLEQKIRLARELDENTPTPMQES